MSLRGKFGFFLVVVIALIILWLALPSASVRSLAERVGNWVEQYNDAVETAQDKGEDKNKADKADKPVVATGKMMVRINDEIGDYSGIDVQPLVKTRFSPESKALAKVVALRPLLQLHARYNQALSALNIRKVAQQSAKQELARLTSLAKKIGSVATKNVTAAQVTLKMENAKLQGLRFDLQAIKEEGMQTWGETVAGWVLAKNSKEWQRLLSHQDSLLLLTLPADSTLAADVSFIHIARNGSRLQARKAYYVSPALTTDQGIQRETYFFKTATGKLRVGMNLDAWLPTSNTSLSGVYIPDQAIVWNDGQAWVYVQRGDDLYQRRLLHAAIPAIGGLFVQQGLVAGDKLVMRGAQMLLSEEFKWQIDDEEDD